MARRYRKKTERQKLKKKVDDLASLIVRSRGYCQLAGLDSIKCGGMLQHMHIEGRDNWRLRWELEFNALCGCGGHHVYYTHHPKLWWEFIEKHFPEQYKYVMEHRSEAWDKDIETPLKEFGELWKNLENS